MSAVCEEILMQGRLTWNLLLLVAGLLYILMVLCDYAASPAFVIVFVALATREMVQSHRGRH
jgi:1,4-dihydroxy-2-naphthoate octaprenyltransferase